MYLQAHIKSLAEIKRTEEHLFYAVMKFKCWGITLKKEYNIQNTAKI
jgi:hypothetical protein